MPSFLATIIPTFKIFRYLSVYFTVQLIACIMQYAVGGSTYNALTQDADCAMSLLNVLFL
jgi:hypothetical protein